MSKNPPPPTFLCFTKVNNKCRYHAVLILTSSLFPVSRKSTHFVDRYNISCILKVLVTFLNSASHLASHAGVFRRARISSLPFGRDEIRAPLKTPAWEATSQLTSSEGKCGSA